jgi:hypothetical protein
MASDFGAGFSRIAAARHRLLEVRATRIEALLRFRAFLRSRLVDFVSTIDPITGVRYAEIVCEGSKTSGDLALTLSFFEGSTLRFSVDRQGRYGLAAKPPDLLLGIGRILEMRVRGDGSHAEFEYEPEGDPGARRSGDLGALVERAIDHVARSAEREAEEIPERRIAFAAQLAQAARARGGLGFSVG